MTASNKRTLKKITLEFTRREMSILANAMRYLQSHSPVRHEVDALLDRIIETQRNIQSD